METNNTPTEKTKVVLTDEEKKSLEDYRGENPFMKSISAMYLKYGTLSDKQVSAFRKTLTNPGKKENLEECSLTKLKLKEICIFKENQDSYETVRVKVIREKALCIESEDKTRTAWIPNKAISIDYEFEETESADVDEIAILSLKDWFTKREDFWKTQHTIEEIQEEERVSNNAKHQIPDTSVSAEAEDDDLPF